MGKKQKTWIEFWNSESLVSSPRWEKNMRRFLQGVENFFTFSKDDIVLDIGCGPGYLEMFLKDRVKEIHCVDTSKRFIDQCKENFKEDKNVFFYLLSADYTDLSFLNSMKFSKIVCSNVVQYYNHANDLEKLILEVKDIAGCNAEFIITDLMGGNLFSDTWGNIKAGINEDLLCDTLLFFLKAMLSEYRRVLLDNKLLLFSQEELHKLIEKLEISAEILNYRLSINYNRRHLLIHF